MEQYIVTGRTNKIDKFGKPFVEVKVANLDEQFSVTIWETGVQEPPFKGQLVRFLALQQDNFGRKCNKDKLLIDGNALEDDKLYNLIPRPIKQEIWDECIKKLISYSTDPELIPIIEKYGADLYKPYSTWPAATNVHHAFPGGLLNHTYQMLHMLEGLYPTLPYPIKIERCIIAILFHDWGKLLEYNREGETQEYMYLLGHIYMSANNLNNILRETLLKPTDSDDEKKRKKREINLIIHCILAHHGQLEYGSPVVPCTKEASLVNYLDNISAKEDTLENNAHMEYVRALNTHVVK